MYLSGILYCPNGKAHDIALKLSAASKYGIAVHQKGAWSVHGNTVKMYMVCGVGVVQIEAGGVVVYPSKSHGSIC